MEEIIRQLWEFDDAVYQIELREEAGGWRIYDETTSEESRILHPSQAACEQHLHICGLRKLKEVE